MIEALQLVLVAVASGAGAWGAMTIKYAWLRRDIDDARAELRGLPCRKPHCPAPSYPPI